MSHLSPMNQVGQTTPEKMGMSEKVAADSAWIGALSAGGEAQSA